MNARLGNLEHRESTSFMRKSICEEALSFDRALNYPPCLDAGFIGGEPMVDLGSININRMMGVDTTLRDPRKTPA